MADAKIKMAFGSDKDPGCQHVVAEITIDKETRRFVFLVDEFGSEADRDAQFAAALANCKTNARRNAGKSIAEKKAAIEGAVFKV